MGLSVPRREEKGRVEGFRKTIKWYEMGRISRRGKQESDCERDVMLYEALPVNVDVVYVEQWRKPLNDKIEGIPILSETFA